MHVRLFTNKKRTLSETGGNWSVVEKKMESVVKENVEKEATIDREKVLA